MADEQDLDLAELEGGENDAVVKATAPRDSSGPTEITMPRDAKDLEAVYDIPVQVSAVLGMATDGWNHMRRHRIARKTELRFIKSSVKFFDRFPVTARYSLKEVPVITGHGKMSEKKAVLTAAGICLLLLAGGAATWLAVMPYPIREWQEARQRSQYSSNWPVSKADFDVAMGLVRDELSFWEIVSTVRVVRSGEIQLDTLQRSSGPLAASGRVFILKKIDGTWKIAETLRWWS